MTREEAKKLYIKVFPDSAKDFVSEWDDIHGEMERVVAAVSDRDAVDVILWWGCWKGDSEREERADCLKAVKRLRKAWARMREVE